MKHEKRVPRARIVIQLTLIVLLMESVLPAEPSRPDWLVTPVTVPATVKATGEGNQIVLSNGLIRRTFRLRPNAAFVAVRASRNG